MKSSFAKKFMVVALALAMVFTFAACGGSSSGGDEGGDAAVLKIGSSGPLTGGASIYGVAVKQGAEIAVAEINEANPDLQIEFKMEDDEADGEKAVNAYNKLKDWGIQIMMGTVTTGSCIATSAVTFEDRVFELTPPLHPQTLQRVRTTCSRSASQTPTRESKQLTTSLRTWQALR